MQYVSISAFDLINYLLAFASTCQFLMLFQRRALNIVVHSSQLTKPSFGIILDASQNTQICECSWIFYDKYALSKKLWKAKQNSFVRLSSIEWPDELFLIHRQWQHSNYTPRSHLATLLWILGCRDGLIAVTDTSFCISVFIQVCEYNFELTNLI